MDGDTGLDVIAGGVFGAWYPVAMSKGPNKKHYHAQRQRQGPAGTSAEHLGTAQLYRDAWAVVTRAYRGARCRLVSGD